MQAKYVREPYGIQTIQDLGKQEFKTAFKCLPTQMIYNAEKHQYF